jgi:hypothetical protein
MTHTPTLIKWTPFNLNYYNDVLYIIRKPISIMQRKKKQSIISLLREKDLVITRKDLVIKRKLSRNYENRSCNYEKRSRNYEKIIS